MKALAAPPSRIGEPMTSPDRLLCKCGAEVALLHVTGGVFDHSAALATPPLDRGIDPKYVEFTSRATEAMTRRLDHGRAKFGVDWDEEPYRDEDNLERLRRAVDHLEAAHRNSPDPAEWRKRAADVANQAFMFADPERLR